MICVDETVRVIQYCKILGIKSAMGHGEEIPIDIEYLAWTCVDEYFAAIINLFHATDSCNLKGIVHHGLNAGCRTYIMSSGYPHGDPLAGKMQKKHTKAYIVIEYNNTLVKQERDITHDLVNSNSDASARDIDHYDVYVGQDGVLMENYAYPMHCIEAIKVYVNGHPTLKIADASLTRGCSVIAVIQFASVANTHGQEFSLKTLFPEEDPFGRNNSRDVLSGVVWICAGC